MIIYYMSISDGIFSLKETQLFSFVSEQRKEKNLKYHFNIDKKLSLYAALLTRMGFSVDMGISEKELIFRYEDFHKPFLLNTC